MSEKTNYAIFLVNLDLVISSFNSLEIDITDSVCYWKELPELPDGEE